MTENAQLIRTFIAVDIPEHIKDAMLGIQTELRPTGADVGWVRPEGMHLTLKFLGDVEAEVVEKICDALAGALADVHSFRLRVAGTGVFPNFTSPRVVWAGLAGDTDALEALRRRVEEVCGPLGFPPECRPFRPHLTLGRIKSPKGRKPLLRALPEFLDKELGSMRAGSVSVIKSDLTPKGAKYTELRRIELLSE